VNIASESDDEIYNDDEHATNNKEYCPRKLQ